MRPVNTCARTGAASAMASSSAALIERVMPPIISATCGGLLQVFLQLRVHLEAALLRRFDLGIRVGEAAREHADDGEVVVRLAKLGIDGNRRAILALRVGHRARAEVR